MDNRLELVSLQGGLCVTRAGGGRVFIVMGQRGRVCGGCVLLAVGGRVRRAGG